MNLENKDFNIQQLIASLFILFMISMLLSNSVGIYLVNPKLRDGSLIMESRYTITHDALDSISEDGVNSVIALGSSMTFKGLDGGCVGEKIGNEVNVYNLAMPMSLAYEDMVHIPQIVHSMPDIVMIEIGPNVLTNISPTHSEYTQFRFKLDTMQQDDSDVGSWIDIIRPEHNDWVALNDIERNLFIHEYVSEAIEEQLRRTILDQSEARKSWAVAPYTNSPNWMDYLQSPSMPSDSYGFEGMDSIEREEYNSTKMSGSAGYAPQENGTITHAALDYEIQTLLDNNIKVILVSLPQHPVAVNLVPNGKWDGFNSTMARYGAIDDVTIFDQLWEPGWEDDHFYDRNHLDDEGRIEFCQRLAPVIDQVLNE